MVQTAIARGMKVYALTEHMPRHKEDFYPEEIAIDQVEEDLVKLIDGFYPEARRLQAKYKDQIDLLVGFESEWIRPTSLDLIQALQSRHKADIFVGSVHHVHTHPIDFDRALYERARDAAGGSDERLFEDYFDAQLAMLQALKPPVVAHFDLIRLMSDEPNGSFARFTGVWERIARNLKFVSSYGGLLEINSAAIRKGMSEPYPKVEICKVFLSLNGKFCMSDDAHGVDQLLHYYSTSDDGYVRVESVTVAEVVAGATQLPTT